MPFWVFLKSSIFDWNNPWVKSIVFYKFLIITFGFWDYIIFPSFFFLQTFLYSSLLSNSLPNFITCCKIHKCISVHIDIIKYKLFCLYNVTYIIVWFSRGWFILDNQFCCAFSCLRLFLLLSAFLGFQCVFV